MGLEASPEQLDSAHRRWVAKSECPYWEDEAHCFHDMSPDGIGDAYLKKVCACGAVVMKVKP